MSSSDLDALKARLRAPDAPPAGASLRIERPEPGLLRWVLAPPHRSLAVFDVSMLEDFEAALAELERDNSIQGLVISGREPLSFAGGADIEAFGRLEDEAMALALVRYGQQLFQRLHRLSLEGGGRIRCVAAVGGPVPGGACELCLACDRIVLALHDKTRIGLPEVKLGIAPGWGGTQRLPRRIGLVNALQAILQGRLYPARQALSLGLVDRLAHPEDLLRIADAVALGRLPLARKRPKGLAGWIGRDPLTRALVASKSKKQVLAETKGRYPAALVAQRLVTDALGQTLEQGLLQEARAIAPLVPGSVSRSLVGLFRLSEEAKKLGRRADGSSAPAVRRGGVIGAGVMGAAIASLMAENGIGARLSDLAPAALAQAQHSHRAEVAKVCRRRRLEGHLQDAMLDRFEVASDLEGFQRCQLVIEAVAERLDVKRKVFAALAERVAPDCLLATNTSSLSVTAIAQGLPHPQRFVGVHFFNPVRKMPLVEIVRTPETSDESVARAARYALDLGKTPVVVRDVAGFLVNRLLGPYLDEALWMYTEGAAPEAVDRALRAFGMPMGPFELLDEVGLDIAGHAGTALWSAYGERMAPSSALAPLLDAKELGKKTGRGIFTYTQRDGRLTSSGLNPRLGVRTGPAALKRPEELAQRALLAMLAESLRALEEEVVSGPRELDLATVFGMGFPPFHGGLLRWADSLGAKNILQQLEDLAAQPELRARPGASARFAPCELLRASARSGRKFHG